MLAFTRMRRRKELFWWDLPATRPGDKKNARRPQQLPDRCYAGETGFTSLSAFFGCLPMTVLNSTTMPTRLCPDASEMPTVHIPPFGKEGWLTPGAGPLDARRDWTRSP